MGQAAAATALCTAAALDPPAIACDCSVADDAREDDAAASASSGGSPAEGTDGTDRGLVMTALAAAAATAPPLSAPLCACTCPCPCRPLMLTVAGCAIAQRNATAGCCARSADARDQPQMATAPAGVGWLVVSLSLASRSQHGKQTTLKHVARVRQWMGEGGTNERTKTAGTTSEVHLPRQIVPTGASRCSATHDTLQGFILC